MVILAIVVGSLLISLSIWFLASVLVKIWDDLYPTLQYMALLQRTALRLSLEASNYEYPEDLEGEYDIPPLTLVPRDD